MTFDFHEGVRALRALPLIELVPMIGIPAYWLGGFAIFIVRCLFLGVPRTERIARAGATVVPRFFLEFGFWFLRPPVWFLLKVQATPDFVTSMGLVFALASGYLLGTGHFSAGGWMLAASAACDTLDGTLARETGMLSERGEFYDSVIDRYADFAVMFGLLYYWRNDLVPALLVMAAIIGSSVMGYAKAKGETVGIDPKGGMMQRHERVLYLIILGCLSPIASAFIEPFAPHPMQWLMLIAVACVALGSNHAAIWRTAYVYTRMPKPQRREPALAKAPASSKAGGDSGDRRRASPESPGLAESPGPVGASEQHV